MDILKGSTLAIWHERKCFLKVLEETLDKSKKKITFKSRDYSEILKPPKGFVHRTFIKVVWWEPRKVRDIEKKGTIIQES